MSKTKQSDKSEETVKTNLDTDVDMGKPKDDVDDDEQDEEQSSAISDEDEDMENADKPERAEGSQKSEKNGQKKKEKGEVSSQMVFSLGSNKRNAWDEIITQTGVKQISKSLGFFPVNDVGTAGVPNYSGIESDNTSKKAPMYKELQIGPTGINVLNTLVNLVMDHHAKNFSRSLNSGHGTTLEVSHINELIGATYPREYSEIFTEKINKTCSEYNTHKLAQTNSKASLAVESN